MKFSGILPEERARGGGSKPPLGVHVVYEEGDHEELEHLFVFLEDHFTIPDEVVARKGRKFRLLAIHPYFQLGDNEVSLPYMLSHIAHLEDIGVNTVVGFLYPGNPYKRRSHDITTFRAYKVHLNTTGKNWPSLRAMYQAIEDEFFPLGKLLN